jgi:hypothetical protein
MKIKSVLMYSLLVLLNSSQSGYSQVTIPSQENIPASSKSFSSSILGKNVFVFDSGMNMKEIQILLAIKVNSAKTVMPYCSSRENIILM